MISWDATLSIASGRQPPQNNGCPDGYFAQFVGPGEYGAIRVPGETYALRCRRMATTTPETIVSESGVTWSEAVQVYTQAAQDTARQVAGALSWTPWVVGGAVLVVGGLLALRMLR